MRMMDGRFMVKETNNAKMITPDSGLDTNLNMYDKKIFLAGPIQGADNWQKEMAQILIALNKDEIHSTLICNPRRADSVTDINYEYQVHWEQYHIHKCNIVLFYIPKEKEKINGRQYGQTTIYELGEMLSLHPHINSKSHIFIAVYTEFPMYKYIRERLCQFTKIEANNIHFMYTDLNKPDHLHTIAKTIQEVGL